MLTFEKYSADCKRLKIPNPYKSKEDFNRAYGIMESIEVLEIRPKHKSSLEAHAKVVNQIRETRSRKRKEKLEAEKKPVAVKEPRKAKPYIPKTDRKMSPKADLKSMTPEQRMEHEMQKRQKYYQQKKLRKQQERMHVPQDPLKKPMKSLIGMSEEQIKQHQSELRRLRRLRKKRDGTLNEKKTPEQLEKQREYNKRYHESKKNDPQYLEKRRIRQQNYRNRDPEKAKKLNKQWREKNLERSREINRNSKRKKRLQSSVSNGSGNRSPEPINKDVLMSKTGIKKESA